MHVGVARSSVIDPWKLLTSTEPTAAEHRCEKGDLWVYSSILDSKFLNSNSPRGAAKWVWVSSILNSKFLLPYTISLKNEICFCYKSEPPAFRDIRSATICLSAISLQPNRKLYARCQAGSLLVMAILIKKKKEYVADVAKAMPQPGAGEITMYMSTIEGEQKECEFVVDPLNVNFSKMSELLEPESMRNTRHWCFNITWALTKHPAPLNLPLLEVSRTHSKQLETL